jgi:deoxyribodipyrimidine photolyase
MNTSDPSIPRGKVLVLLAEDLRLEDNLAFSIASDPAREGFAVLRILPEARGRPLRTRHRRKIEEAAEMRLGQQLRQIGTLFEVVGPDDDVSLVKACRRLGCTSVIRNAADGMAVENAYRAAWEQELQSANIPFLTVNGEMIRRVGLGGAKPERPFLSYDRTVESDKLPEGHPILLLRAFLQVLPERNYRSDMWIPGRDRESTSQLSTHFAAGTLSSDRAAWETTKAEKLWKAANPGPSRSTEEASFRHYRNRIAMRTGFLTVFSRYQDKTLPLVLNDAERNRVSAWREGRTGIPMPDAAMRELAATGWINFRLRQMVTSYGVQLLRLPAAAVGGALAEMFDDYEPGITWPQVALNDGTMMQDRGPRILNPVKQGHDLDPSEAYVRHWLPELEAVPAGFAHEPWLWFKNPLPAPLIDHKAAFREARARWGKQDDVLVSRDDVLRSHSLS